jgi:hypothetical protein
LTYTSIGYIIDVYPAVREIKMKTSAIATVKWAIEEGMGLQLSSPSGLHDIDLDEAIDAINECEDEDIRVEDDVVIFGMGDVCIKIADPDDYNADASNHVTGE